jgi:hypothetical protein
MSQQELPTPAEGDEAVRRLGVNIEEWARDIRSRVNAAMKGPALYLEVRRRLFLAREQAGGKLTQEEEAQWATDLESVWVELSDPERQRLDS